LFESVGSHGSSHTGHVTSAAEDLQTFLASQGFTNIGERGRTGQRIRRRRRPTLGPLLPTKGGVFLRHVVTEQEAAQQAKQAAAAEGDGVGLEASVDSGGRSPKPDDRETITTIGFHDLVEARDSAKAWWRHMRRRSSVAMFGKSSLTGQEESGLTAFDQTRDVLDANTRDGRRCFISPKPVAYCRDDSVKGQLIRDAQYGNMATVTMHLAEMAKISDNRGWTPLHAAAVNGHLRIARMLVNAGANIRAIAKNGCTPVRVAVRRGQDELVEYFRTLCTVDEFEELSERREPV
jgi:hypothetical protein